MFSSLLIKPATPTIQWWVWLILIVLIVLLILLLWWLFRKDRSEPTLPMASSAPESHAEPAPVVSRITEPVVVPDDIKIIEGIGPKIEKILNGEGITTFAALAATEVTRLEEILLANNLLRIANPATWPEQARLAAEGKMEELQVYQNQLKGGRVV